MGITIRFQNEQGDTIEEFYDIKNILHRLLPTFDDESFCCLRFIDWYGDTTFNGLQMDLFLAELDRISIKAVGSEEKTMVENIRRLAQKCQDSVHTYLKFIGD
jgi:hypothetical protein